MTEPINGEMVEKDFGKIYRLEFHLACKEEDYFKAHEIYQKNSGLEDFMTNQEMIKMINCGLDKNS